jgi:uncharacterized protein YdbL (DUF1318 family)
VSVWWHRSTGQTLQALTVSNFDGSMTTEVAAVGQGEGGEDVKGYLPVVAPSLSANTLWTTVRTASEGNKTSVPAVRTKGG